MKISAKARYALATITYIASHYPDVKKFNILEVAQALGISKIYLEQVFAQLKNSGIVLATKGPKGGYSLSRDPNEISAYDVLAATESSMFEPVPPTVEGNALEIEKALNDLVFSTLDQSIRQLLSSITIKQLADNARENSVIGYMYYL